MDKAKDIIKQLRKRYPLFMLQETKSGAVEIDLVPSHPSRAWIDEVNEDVLAMLDREHKKRETHA
jgi:hypothetical protein